jgi:hypothetical protein
MGEGKHIHKWELSGPGGAKAEIHYHPRLITTDMLALREAAMAGVGVVQLPILMVKDQLASGELVRVLDAWEPRREVIHAVYPAARPAAVGQDAGGFSDRRVCADGGRVTLPSPWERGRVAQAARAVEPRGFSSPFRRI